MTLVQAIALMVRRFVRSAGALLFALSLLALVALGFFDAGGEASDAPTLTTGRLAVMAAWLVIFGWRAFERFRDAGGGAKRSTYREAELGLLLVGMVYALISLGGGLQGPLHPLAYVLVAFLISFSSWRPVAVAVIAALALELVRLIDLPPTELAWTMGIHGAFMAIFASLHAVFTRGEIARLQATGRQRVEEEMVRAEQIAREFRLMAAPTTSGEETLDAEEQARRRTLSAVMELRQSIYFSLDLLKRSLSLHTAALLWLDRAGRLKLTELASDCDEIVVGPYESSLGVLGAALACGQVVNLHNLRGKLAHVPYYATPGKVGCLLAVPVVEKGKTRGLLCADRLDPEAAFGQREVEALEAAARYVLQAAENERVFVALERAKAEQTKLYRASEALGAALTERDAIDAVLDAAHGIAPFDFAAIALYDPDTGRHEIVRARGEGAEELEGLVFADNSGLASMAIKNRHYLPYRGQFDSKRQMVYTRSARLKGMESLLILPLISQDEPLGTLTLAAREPGAFGDTVRRTIQVLTNQMATAVTNARMVRKLREMATTDGLTGLLNHRVFQDELEKKLKSAERFGHQLSVIITDLDKFKSVNDTYGHPVGDEVLRGFSRVLSGAMRETDLVARYGGEEFAIICEQTDSEGALRLANRIREEMGSIEFESEIGTFHVTCSLGIATFPDHATTKEALVEAADQALYHAKENGRNRAVISRAVPSRSSRPSASPAPRSRQRHRSSAPAGTSPRASSAPSL